MTDRSAARATGDAILTAGVPGERVRDGPGAVADHLDDQTLVVAPAAHRAATATMVDGIRRRLVDRDGQILATLVGQVDRSGALGDEVADPRQVVPRERPPAGTR